MSLEPGDTRITRLLARIGGNVATSVGVSQINPRFLRLKPFLKLVLGPVAILAKPFHLCGDLVVH